MSKTWTAPAGALADALQSVMTAADKSADRNFDCVYVRCRDTELTLAATNGHRLAEARLPVERLSDSLEAECLVQHDMLGDYTCDTEIVGRQWKPLTFVGYDAPGAKWKGGRRATFRCILKYLRSGRADDPVTLAFDGETRNHRTYGGGKSFPPYHLALELECPERGRLGIPCRQWSFPAYESFFEPLRNGAPATGTTNVNVRVEELARIVDAAWEWRKEGKGRAERWRWERITLSLTGKRLRATTAHLGKPPAHELVVPVAEVKRRPKGAVERTFDSAYIRDALTPLKKAPNGIVRLFFQRNAEHGCFLTGTVGKAAVGFRTVVMPTRV